MGGPASGKTTALHAFADERNAAGVKCLFASGDSTLAGIRQELAAVGDYKAVLLDEGGMQRQQQADIISGLLGMGLDHIVVASSRHPAESACDALLADLTEAAATLRRYETLHRAKGTADSTAKAEVNAKLATRFEATIAKVQGGAA